MRLVYRDKGCAVCLAAGIQNVYKYSYHSNLFEGSHIIPFALHGLVSHCLLSTFLTYTVNIKWDSKGYSGLVKDPFTGPANADNQQASTSTRTKPEKDCRRINSLENGILLCLEHHRNFRNFHIAINPNVRTSFLPHTISNFLLSSPTKYFLLFLTLSNSKASK